MGDDVTMHRHRLMPRWKLAFWATSIGSLLWLLLRSRANPKRLVCPCQRVAASTSLGFLAYLAALIGSVALLRRLRATLSAISLLLFVFSLILTVSLQGSVITTITPVQAAGFSLPGWGSSMAVSSVFAVTNIPAPQYSLDRGHVPRGVSADEVFHDIGVDALVNLMETNGAYFYEIATHPSGSFGSNDVIVIKVSDQWGGRDGANTNVVKGSIYRLVRIGFIRTYDPHGDRWGGESEKHC